MEITTEELPDGTKHCLAITAGSDAHFSNKNRKWNYLFRFLKWDFFLKRAGVYLNPKDNLLVFFSGLSMIITPGKVGEIWKGWLIKDINGGN